MVCSSASRGAYVAQHAGDQHRHAAQQDQDGEQLGGQPEARGTLGGRGGNGRIGGGHASLLYHDKNDGRCPKRTAVRLTDGLRERLLALQMVAGNQMAALRLAIATGVRSRHLSALPAAQDRAQPGAGFLRCSRARRSGLRTLRLDDAHRAVSSSRRATTSAATSNRPTSPPTSRRCPGRSACRRGPLIRIAFLDFYDMAQGPDLSRDRGRHPGHGRHAARLGRAHPAGHQRAGLHRRPRTYSAWPR